MSGIVPQSKMLPPLEFASKKSASSITTCPKVWLTGKTSSNTSKTEKFPLVNSELRVFAARELIFPIRVLIFSKTTVRRNLTLKKDVNYHSSELVQLQSSKHYFANVTQCFVFYFQRILCWAYTSGIKGGWFKKKKPFCSGGKWKTNKEYFQKRKTIVWRRDNWEIQRMRRIPLC